MARSISVPVLNKFIMMNTYIKLRFKIYSENFLEFKKRENYKLSDMKANIFMFKK